MPGSAVPPSLSTRTGSHYRKIPHTGWLLICLGLAAFLIAGCVGGSSAGFTVVFRDSQTWTADLPAPPTAGFAGGEGISGPWLQSLTDLGVQVEGDLSLNQIVPGKNLRLSGDGGTEQLAALIYGPLSDEVEPLSPGTTLTLSGAVQAGERVTVTLEANPSTGYGWQVAEGDRPLWNVIETADPTIVSSTSAYTGPDLEETALEDLAFPEPLTGVPQPQVLSFQALESGPASLTLVYRRPWEPVSPGVQVSIHASTLAQISDLSRPGGWIQADVAAAGEALPSTDDASLSPSMDTGTPLPTAFDWRTQRVLPAVRDQGSCGSCWAFATVGAFEGAIVVQGGPASTDLSEQYLVSCNLDRWGCNGGSTAHPYHKDVYPSSELMAGGVLESQFPYKAADPNSKFPKVPQPCNGPYTHPYRIDGWGFTSSRLNPTVEEIKQAIYTYGPVKASVCVGTAFNYYKSGIFSTDEKAACDGYTNHAVVLVGWDDKTGTWILRNSWGPGWGEAGYMRITWGTSNVGRYTSYVVYNGPVPANHHVFIPSVAKK